MKLIILVTGLILSSVSTFAADDKSAVEQKETKRSPSGVAANVAAEGRLVTVYKFMEVVGDQKFLCFFSEVKEVKYMDSAPAVICNLLK